MAKDNGLKYLKKAGFKSRAHYERYVHDKISDLEFFAPQIFKIFREKVIEWEQNFLKNKRKRLVAEAISPPGNKLIKSSERIAQKVIDSWEEYDEWKKAPGKKNKEGPLCHDPKKFSLTMYDLVRFRIVCNYFSDVRYIEKCIEDENAAIRNKIRGFDKNCKSLHYKKKDSTETPYPERRVGHRAVHFNFKYGAHGHTVTFEVQVMSQLQHAWDKKDHHLVYEPVRTGQGNKIPGHLKNRMAAMSELLYVADNAFDTLRCDIANCLGEEQ